MKRLTVFTCTLLLATSVAVWAQQGGGGQGGGGNEGGGGNQGGGQGGGGGGGNQGGGNQGGGQNQDPFGGGRQSTIQPAPRPIYLSGEVVLSNGEIPPEPVTIERICNGVNTPEDYTDTKGRFSFEVGGDPTLAMSDASVAGGGFGGAGGGRFPGSGIGGFGAGGGGGLSGPDIGVDLSGCEIRGVLSGFRSESIQLGRRRPMENPDIGRIVLTPLDGFRGKIVSATTLQAPKKAKASYDKAFREMVKKNSDPEKAIKELDKAVALYPQFAAAWAVMGDAKLKMNNENGAIKAYEKAVEADPDYFRPYEGLIRLGMKQQNWELVDKYSDKALAMNPNQTSMRYASALASFSTGDVDSATMTAKAIIGSPDAAMFPQAHQMLGMIYANKGQFVQASGEFRNYLTISPNSPSAAQIKKQLNEWEVLGVIEPAESKTAQQ